jgi:choline dehydrogenase-like flavoprotein
MEDRQVVIIGSGPAGASAAHELVSQGIPVVMLEAGRHLPGGMLVRINGRNVYRQVPPGIKTGDRHTATGDPKTQWWYYLSPGGLSNQWTGAVPRFAPEDFHEGARLDERYRWPITYDDLAPYYDRIEPLMAVTASAESVHNLPASKPAYRRRLPRDWQRVARIADGHGQGLTIMPLADGPPWMLTRRGTAFNSYNCIIQPLLRSPHFKMLTGAHCLRLEYSGAEGRVTAVIYHNRADNSEQRLNCAAVVLACGPLNSTKLLFDSACDVFPHGLGNAEGVLGRYLHDHPREWWPCELDKPISRLSPAGYLTRRPYAESSPLLATSWTIGLLSSIKEKILSLTPAKARGLGVQVFGTTIPQEKYYVQPYCDKRDEFGLPLLDICMQYDDEVIQTMVDARERLLNLMSEAGYRCTIRELVPQLHPGSSVHYGGTIRMHRSPEYGMADAWNRLHAVPNVIVGDASCFTTGPEKNPTLTLMALAMRAADRLACDLKTG